MATKTYGIMNAKDLHVIRVAFVIVIFWMAVWSLMEEFIGWVEQRYECARWKIYTALLVLALLIIAFDPHVFEKL